MIKLYDLVGRDDRRFSPTCWRVKMALAHKGVPFETVPVPFTRISAIGGGVTKTVPCIEVEGRFQAESGDIAAYLDAAYADAPALLGDAATQALTRFVDGWVLTTLHGQLAPMVILDIHDHCHADDRAYFRSSREGRLGRSLEDIQAGREQRLEAFRTSLAPLRVLVEKQPFLGGEAPLYADYMVLGAFQWARTVSNFRVLAEDDPVRTYLERMMGLHDGLAAAAVAYPL